MQESAGTGALCNTTSALRAFIEAAPYGALIVNRDGAVSFCNSRAGDLLQKPPAHIHDLRFPQDFIETPGTVPFPQVLDQTRLWSNSVSWKFAGGESAAATLETTLLPLALEDGEAKLGILLHAPGHSGILERRYIQAEKLNALDNVVAGVAHELNNPLTVVLGYSELLLEKPLDADVKSRLSIICEKAERCRRIVDNLLRFSRSKDALRTRLDLNELIHETLALCEYQLKTDSITLNLQLDNELPPVAVQRRELQGVILSLINNAQQALADVNGRPKVFSVRTEQRNDKVLISFCDSGCGIPEDIQHRIFDPFFTTRDIGEGLGLGLSVAYGVVLEHHGRIWLEESTGESTTFVIELPLKEDATAS